MSDLRELLALTSRLAADYLESLEHRPVLPAVDTERLRAALAGPLPDRPTPARDVIAHLARQPTPGSHAERPLVRLRPRRERPRRPRRRLAHVGVGPERRPLRARSGGRRRFAAELARLPGCTILNDVVLTTRFSFGSGAMRRPTQSSRRSRRRVRRG